MSDIEQRPGFVVRQLGEIEVNGQDGTERIDGLLLEGTHADIRAAGAYFLRSVAIIPVDELASLRSKLEEAEGALEPFASLIDALDRVPDAAEIAALPSAKIDQVLSLKVGDLRRALQAVGPEPAAWMHPYGAIWRADRRPDDIDFSKDGWVPLYTALVATPPAEPVVEDIRKAVSTTMMRHIGPDGWTIGRGGCPRINWHQLCNELVAALATKPAVKDDETVVDAPYGWVYFNEDTGTEWSESHPVTSGEVPDATEIRPCGENEKPWIDELRLRDDQLFHLRPLVEAARTFLASPNIVKLTVNGKRMTPQEVAAALAARDGRHG